MKIIVHNAKEKLNALHMLIVERVGNSDRFPRFEVSDPKSDGTVFVRFISREGYSASTMCNHFVGVLVGLNLPHQQTDTNKVRVALDLFVGRL